MSNDSPKPEHKFTFYLWTVGNRGAAPLSPQTHEHKTPAELICLLGKIGALYPLLKPTFVE